MSHTISAPITVKLQGGILDGDTYEFIPNGSVMPPMRLSYPWHEVQGLDTYSCWLNYEYQGIPEWTYQELIYVYAGKERMGAK